MAVQITPPIILTETYSGMAKKAPRVAIFPKWVKGLQTEIADDTKTRVFYPLGDRRSFVCDLPITAVIALLWPVPDGV